MKSCHREQDFAKERQCLSKGISYLNLSNISTSLSSACRLAIRFIIPVLKRFIVTVLSLPDTIANIRKDSDIEVSLHNRFPIHTENIYAITGLSSEQAIMTVTTIAAIST